MSNPKSKKWTAKAPAGTTSWDRIRLYANEDDYRSLIWPPLDPIGVADTEMAIP